MKNAFCDRLHPALLHYSVILLLIVSLAACNKKADTDEADIKSIEAAISLFSVSLARADTTALKEICAPEFVLFDEGKPYELSRLFTSITEVHVSNAMRRQPVGVQVATRPEGAWSCYNVAGKFQSEGESNPHGVIESAYLERARGQWKIVQVCTIETDTE